MSTLLLSNAKFSLTKYWGGDKVMYQITQKYGLRCEDDSTRNTWGYVQVSKKELKQMIREIEKHEN